MAEIRGWPLRERGAPGFTRSALRTRYAPTPGYDPTIRKLAPTAQRDGSVLAFVGPCVIVDKVVKPNLKFEPKNLTWVGRIGNPDIVRDDEAERVLPFLTQ